jgi:hypothetical protein
MTIAKEIMVVPKTDFITHLILTNVTKINRRNYKQLSTHYTCPFPVAKSNWFV